MSKFGTNGNLIVLNFFYIKLLRKKNEKKNEKREQKNQCETYHSFLFF